MQTHRDTHEAFAHHNFGQSHRLIVSHEFTKVIRIGSICDRSRCSVKPNGCLLSVPIKLWLMSFVINTRTACVCSMVIFFDGVVHNKLTFDGDRSDPIMGGLQFAHCNAIGFGMMCVWFWWSDFWDDGFWWLGIVDFEVWKLWWFCINF